MYRHIFNTNRQKKKQTIMDSIEKDFNDLKFLRGLVESNKKDNDSLIDKEVEFIMRNDRRL